MWVRRQVKHDLKKKDYRTKYTSKRWSVSRLKVRIEPWGDVSVPHLYSHLSHKNRCEDVVGQSQEDPLLQNSKERKTWWLSCSTSHDLWTTFWWKAFFFFPSYWAHSLPPKLSSAQLNNVLGRFFPHTSFENIPAHTPVAVSNDGRRALVRFTLY